MTDVLFYHLDRQPLDRVLPKLLQLTLERGWRAVVQAGSAERVEALDTLLWTFEDESFLPHGTAADGNEAEQPVFLAADDANPNRANVRFLVDRAGPPTDAAAYERLVLLFDGNDPDALADARQHWKALKAAGHAVTYWQQNEQGRWVKKAG